MLSSFLDPSLEMVEPSSWPSYRAGFVERESVMNMLYFKMKFQLSLMLDFLCLLA